MLETEQQRLLADRYELTELVGAGGAARVYRATDRQLGRDVAVKLLDDAAAKSADPAARQRFLHEARTAAGFDHPNIVTVYDAGTDGDALFLVMELVPGHTLADHIARHAPLPVEEAVGLARQIADGLAAAHSRGIVHRDIKPANVLLDRAGRVRLTDFGIAKHLDEIEAAITTDGMVVGTPAYIAPEQAMGKALSPATDVYALGVVLHEMLTGWHAPRGNGAATAWRMAPLDPRRHRPETPAPVAEAVLRATDRDPARRFPSAASLLTVLGGAVPVDDDPTPPTAPAVAPAPVPTATMHAGAPSIGATALLPPLPGEPTVALGAAATEPGPTRSAWPVIVLVVMALAVAAAVVAADRSARSTTVTTPPSAATTVAAPATTLAPVVTTVPPPVVAPVEQAPAGGGGDDEGAGNGNGNGNGKAKGKDDDD